MKVPALFVRPGDARLDGRVVTGVRTVGSHSVELTHDDGDRETIWDSATISIVRPEPKGGAA